MMVAAERAPWQNPKIVSTLMVVFLAGAATGALTMQVGLHKLLHRGPTRITSQNRDAILNQFRTELGLTPTQTEKLASVLDDFANITRVFRTSSTTCATPERIRSWRFSTRNSARSLRR